jgi:hypothetical protein
MDRNPARAGFDALEVLSALRANGAISQEDEHLLATEWRSGQHATSAAPPTSRLDDAEYWSLRFLRDLLRALGRTGRIIDRACTLGREDERLLREHEQAILDAHRARLGSYDTVDGAGDPRRPE